MANLPFEEVDEGLRATLPRRPFHVLGPAHAALLEGKTLFVPTGDRFSDESRNNARLRANGFSSWARTKGRRATTRIREKDDQMGVYVWLVPIEA